VSLSCRRCLEVIGELHSTMDIAFLGFRKPRVSAEHNESSFIMSYYAGSALYIMW